MEPEIMSRCQEWISIGIKPTTIRKALAGHEGLTLFEEECREEDRYIEAGARIHGFGLDVGPQSVQQPCW